MRVRLWIAIVLAAGMAILVLLASVPLGASPLGAPWVALPLAAANGLNASGTIEADEYRVSPQVGGRIQSLLADEGDEVSAGQVLVRLDDALMQSELKKAIAGRSAAQAALAQVTAGARPEDLRKAEAGVLMARAARDGAKVAWEDAVLARDNPQELDLKIAAARSQLAAAEARLRQAAAGTEAAQAQYDMWATIADMIAGPQRVCFTIPGSGGKEVCQDVNTPRQFKDDASFQWNQAAQQLAGAWDAVSLATAARDAAQANLESLQAQRANPLAANAQVDAALAQYKALDSAVKEAEAALALAKAGATPEQVRMAEAGLAQAEAAVLALQVQLDKFTLRAPAGGLVTARSVEEGEMAIPGVSLFTLANLDEVKLTLYIPEAQIARVRVGQKVSVQVDSFPGRSFQGRVTYISPQAEFTPRAVQTQEERAKTVFAVRVTIANPDHALKPGMPADAAIEEAL